MAWACSSQETATSESTKYSPFVPAIQRVPELAFKRKVLSGSIGIGSIFPVVVLMIGPVGGISPFPKLPFLSDTLMSESPKKSSPVQEIENNNTTKSVIFTRPYLFKPDYTLYQEKPVATNLTDCTNLWI